MNKTIKLILIVIGVVLTLYGVFKIVSPETSVDIGIAEFTEQNNKDAYITLGLGIVVLLVSFFTSKK
ncbi:hypothetical protein [Tenacibaculum sp. L6]|uniref:hypothetical protein n=1 Tax=Tenacibaculum sp. L6 TaxID=2992764 RepID=UPI00237BF8EE|nr:hypothetical protein [Tenacibaculum sp. L6]MDE0537030.1 hypothetical protein [Tenacibaculum sp. L6]